MEDDNVTDDGNQQITSDERELLQTFAYMKLNQDANHTDGFGHPEHNDKVNNPRTQNDETSTTNKGRDQTFIDKKMTHLVSGEDATSDSVNRRCIEEGQSGLIHGLRAYSDIWTVDTARGQSGSEDHQMDGPTDLEDALLLDQDDETPKTDKGREDNFY